MGSELFAHAGLRWHEEWPGRAEPLEQEPHGRLMRQFRCTRLWGEEVRQEAEAFRG